jgi:hypothetical protein
MFAPLVFKTSKVFRGFLEMLWGALGQKFGGLSTFVADKRRKIESVSFKEVKNP